MTQLNVWLVFCAMWLLSGAVLPTGRLLRADEAVVSTGSSTDDTDFAGRCRALFRSTVRIISETGDRSSGVLVSEAGVILTVAHGLNAEATAVTVVTSNGTSLRATVLLRDTESDFALLQLMLPARQRRALHPAAICLADSSLSSGQPVLALGFPARDPTGQSPVLRLGRLVAVTDRLLRSSCALTAGDSGGPLFDASGRLVAIHQKIGAGRNGNLHLPLTLLRKTVPDLFQQLQRCDPSVFPQQRLLSQLYPTSETEAQLIRRTVRISKAGGPSLCQGTLLDSQTVVTKLSEVALWEDITVSSGPIKMAARILGQDRRYDLAILRLTNPPDDLIRINTPAENANPPATGRFVYYRPQTPAAVVSRHDHQEPSGKPTLGATLLTGPGYVVVESVTPDGSAALAGLQAGDQLLQINEKPVTTLEEFAQQIQNFEPGDCLQLTIRRKLQQLAIKCRLQHAANNLLERTEYLDGLSGSLSLRRTGFHHVIQHDAGLAPHEMGGPLLDADGRLLGINIARRGREAVFAVPIAVVDEVVSSVTDHHNKAAR